MLNQISFYCWKLWIQLNILFFLFRIWQSRLIPMWQDISSYQVRQEICLTSLDWYFSHPDLLDMMSRIILERNYDAQIEDAFRRDIITWKQSHYRDDGKALKQIIGKCYRSILISSPSVNVLSFISRLIPPCTYFF